MFNDWYTARHDSHEGRVVRILKALDSCLGFVYG